MKTIFWVAGEKSGDTHGAKVLEMFPDVNHVGIGGPLMQNHGLKVLFPFERFCVMGFAEVITHLPFFIMVERTIKKYLISNKPDLIILIDYPGLNMRIAKLAHSLKIKVLYYICPQFWAWKQHRILKLKKYCDFVACILPFEKDMLDLHGIKNEYVGHPVIEEIDVSYLKNEFAQKFGLDINKKWISFFPGSRLNEVIRLLPIFLKTIVKLNTIKPDFELLISKSNSISDKEFSKLLTVKDANYKLINDHSHEMMKYATFSIVKSGTSTFEAASIGKPFAIVYIANNISYLIAKKIIKVKYIGLPNLIFGKSVIKELIQHDVNPNKIIDTILSCTDNLTEYENQTEALKGFQKHMGDKSASKNVFQIIKQLLL